MNAKEKKNKEIPVFISGNKDGSHIVVKLNKNDVLANIDIYITNMNLLDDSLDKLIQTLRAYQHKAYFTNKKVQKQKTQNNEK